jgi:hypothetical protein
MISPRGGFAVAPLGHGRFLFVGGTNGNQVVASAETAESVAAPEIYDGPLQWNQTHPGGIELSFDTTRFTNGPHLLTTRAYDAEGVLGRPGYDGPGINGGRGDHLAPIHVLISN